MSKQIKNGVVVECQKGFVFVCEIKHTLEEKINILESEIWLVRTKSNFKRPDAFNNICVGDMVEFEQATAVKDSGVDLPTAKILLVKKRSNTLVKPTKRSPKDFASNFAKLLILEDLSHLNTGFLCRYLCLAELQGITPLVIGNKLDIGNDQEKILDYLKGVGVDCIKLSATEMSGDFSELCELTTDGVHVLVGRSGVGKSSLLNALGPKLVQATDELRSNNFGRHVTSYASMHKVESGGWVVDSPGIQVLTLKGYDKDELRWGFREFEKYARECKFRDCLHISETKCGIKVAVETGTLPEWRYKSYMSLIGECE